MGGERQKEWDLVMAIVRERGQEEQGGNEKAREYNIVY